MRIPSSRALATALHVSRNTVANAYEQLMVEGFLEGRTGAGTYVSPSIPDRTASHLKQLHKQPHEQPQKRSEKQSRRRSVSQTGHPELSERGNRITGIWTAIGRDQYRSNAFRPRLPALEKFPLEVWSRMISRRWRNMPSDMLTYGDPAGYGPLREVLANYLRETRDVACEPHQVIILSGTPQAISLTVTVLLDRGDSVLMEDPGNPRARATLIAADAEVVPVAVDQDGLDLKSGLTKSPGAKMAYVTPAHQYPLGVTMSLARRLELLNWAADKDGWILEDDYGTEFSNAGLPLAALAKFDYAERVIYTGTFNDVVFPALRLGYLVVPSHLVDAFISARILIDRCPPLLGQVVLADFIADGHFERHVKALRPVYEERHRTLLRALKGTFGSLLQPRSEEVGMHLVVDLPADVDDRKMSKLIAEHDVEAPPLSFYSMKRRRRGGFVLGYSSVKEQEIRIGVERMHEAIAHKLRH